MKKILPSPFSILNFRRSRANLPQKQKKPRWQKEQADKRVKKTKKTLKFWLFLSALLIFLGASFKLLRIFSQSVWRGEERVSLVFSCEPFTVFSFSSPGPSLTKITLSPKTQIEVIHGYGQYKLEAIPKLEELEKRKLLAQSLEYSLKIPIDGFIRLDDCQAGERIDTKKFFRKVLIKAFIGEGETNLTKWDLSRLFWAMRSVAPSQVKDFDLEAFGVLEEVTLADGSQVFKIQPEKFWLKAKDLLIEERARKEGLSVEILNAAGQPGLAEGASKILLNMGLKVVGIDNALEKKDDCLVEGLRQNRKSYIAKRLLKIFDCQYVEKAPEKADLSLILGEAYWRKLKVK